MFRFPHAKYNKRQQIFFNSKFSITDEEIVDVYVIKDRPQSDKDSMEKENKSNEKVSQIV